MKWLRGIVLLPAALVEMIVTYLPGPVGYALRERYWRRRLGGLGRKVRIEPDVHFQSPKLIMIGDGCWIDKGVILLAGEDRSGRARRLLSTAGTTAPRGTIRIGADVHVGAYCLISGIGGVSIGNECTLSAGVRIYSFSHHYRSDEHPADRRIRFGSPGDPKRQFLIEGAVVLEENVGVALGAVILPGVRIARDSFVMIHSVVSHSAEENSLIAGQPATRIRARFSSS
ncbi:MAG TPA: DapH/DapD/GlmU-related protein [Gemmatimonadaceae bacterium]|nr:DapH/DapD/GlmU-related protein [Gemmatimonadaceae bacterium]